MNFKFKTLKEALNKSARFFSGLGFGLTLTALTALIMVPQYQLPTKAEVEAMARGYGMVYREEVLAFSTPENSLKAGNRSDLVKVTVPPGSTSAEIAQILVEKGVIKEAGPFEKRVRDRKTGDRLNAGEFFLSPDWGLDKIIDTLLI